jgi:hypothetical protein
VYQVLPRMVKGGNGQTENVTSTLKHVTPNSNMLPLHVHPLPNVR